MNPLSDPSLRQRMTGQPHADEWDIAAAQHENRSTRDEDGECQKEQQPTVTLHFDSEHGQVADDRAGDDAERQECAKGDRCRIEQQQRSDQLDDTRTDAAPGLGAERRKDLDGFCRAREFEKQRLQQDARDNELKRPAHGDGDIGQPHSVEPSGALMDLGALSLRCLSAWWVTRNRALTRRIEGECRCRS